MLKAIESVFKYCSGMEIVVSNCPMLFVRATSEAILIKSLSVFCFEFCLWLVVYLVFCN